MGVMVEGVWRGEAALPCDQDGRFVRAPSRFRDRVSADGASLFPAEPGRYHLYVSLACPWAHRTLIVRALKGLGAAVSVTVVDPILGEDGWTFGAGREGGGDALTGARLLSEVYALADPYYTGRVTVPVLWDKFRRTIVNNESADIVRMLNAAFDGCGASALDLYPAALRPEIDRVNAFAYEAINNGVYRAGFAATQAAYEEAVEALFAALDSLEDRLVRRRYLVGDRFTEADWRLFTTLVRFDAVYYGHFKCNKRRLVDYPNLWAYTRDLYQVPNVAQTVDLDHIKRHYYRSHRRLNPSGIVPAGPELDFTAAHGRAALSAPDDASVDLPV